MRRGSSPACGPRWGPSTRCGRRASPTCAVRSPRERIASIPPRSRSACSATCSEASSAEGTSVTETIATLCRVLEDEARTCETLVDLLQREQRAMVALRPEDISACAAERHVVGETLVRCAAERTRVAGDLARTVGARGTSAIDVLPLLPSADGGRVRDGIRRLRRALVDARALERQNGLLAAASLATVSEMLAALRSSVPGARYGADARVEAPARERLDRRV